MRAVRRLSRHTFVAGALVGVTIALVALLRSFSGEAQVAPHRAAVSEPITPLCNGTSADLPTAVKDMPFAILVPEMDLASDATIVGVCVVIKGESGPGSEQGVVIRYASGITVREYTPPDAAPDPETAWKSIVDAYPDSGYSVGTVRGQSALLVVPGGPLNAYGGAIWVEGNVEIEVEGDGKIPLTDLLSVAGALVPSTASPTATT